MSKLDAQAIHKKKSNKTKTKAIKVFDFNTSKVKRYILTPDCQRLE